VLVPVTACNPFEEEEKQNTARKKNKTGWRRDKIILISFSWAK
jgi:hypothetical protein